MPMDPDDLADEYGEFDEDGPELAELQSRCRQVSSIRS